MDAPQRLSMSSAEAAMHDPGSSRTGSRRPEPAGWTLHSIVDKAELERLVVPDQARQGQELEHDPRWHAALLGNPGKAVLVGRAPSGVMVSVYVHDVGLPLQLGELALTAMPVERFVLWGNLPAAGVGVAEAEQLLLALHARLGPRSVAFLQGVADGEPLHRALRSAAVGSRYLVLPYGPAYDRCLIELAGGTGAYLDSLGRNTRKDVRKTLRRFDEAFGERARLIRIDSLAELAPWFPALETLAGKTYQARLLGLALTADGFLGAQLRGSLARGEGRVYLLAVDDRPVAFKVGHVRGGTYFSTTVGYDPDWATWNPGVVIHVKLIEDLARSEPEVTRFDFMHGDSVFKRRMSNRFRREGHYYLFPRCLRGAATFAALLAVNKLSASAGALLERMHAKAAIKKLIRRRA